MLDRDRLRKLLQPILLHPMQQHGQHIDFEKPANDALQLQSNHTRSESKRLDRELVSRKLIVALDRTGDQGREIQRVEQVGAKCRCAAFLLPGFFAGFDQQVQHAEEICRKVRE